MGQEPSTDWETSKPSGTHYESIEAAAWDFWEESIYYYFDDFLTPYIRTESGYEATGFETDAVGDCEETIMLSIVSGKLSGIRYQYIYDDGDTFVDDLKVTYGTPKIELPDAVRAFLDAQNA